jgi:hypothetical protein
MTPIGNTRFIERNRFFNNERLVASDLDAIDDFARQMRWLHNRSLHQPGVASGYAVSGSKGDSQVTVQPGYAIDALGREIVLTRAQTQPVPPTSGDGQGGPAIYDLTVSYPATLPPSETRNADCASAMPGTVRLEESPVFCWVSTTLANDAQLRTDISNGMRLVLTRVQVLNCQIYAISVAPRTDARPGVHPYIFTAQVTPKWAINGKSAFGVELTTDPIDTSAAGFRTTPGYFVNLLSDPIVDLTDPLTKVSKQYRLEVLTNITCPASKTLPAQKGFGVSLLIPTLPLFFAQLSVADVAKALGQPTWKPWTIGWMGVEG